jgi:hypothetical protein
MNLASSRTLEYNKDIILKLKKHIDKGIELLLAITKTDKRRHPLLIAKNERIYRLNSKNHKDCLLNSVKLYHAAVLNAEDLKALQIKLDIWANKCCQTFKKGYSDIRYHNHFDAIGFLFDLATYFPSNTDKDAALLAQIQINLKTQLEDKIYFMLRRLAYFEEFGPYPPIMKLDLKIEDYTKKLLEVLIKEKLFSWVDVYPEKYNPLHILLHINRMSEFRMYENADTDTIVDIIGSFITNPHREQFYSTISKTIIDSSEASKNICDKITIVKDNFERDFKQVTEVRLPGKFSKLWDKEVTAIEQTFDLMTALNRLPIYMRDELQESGNNYLNERFETTNKGNSKNKSFSTPLGASWENMVWVLARADGYSDAFKIRFQNIEFTSRKISCFDMGFRKGRGKQTTSKDWHWLIDLLFISHRKPRYQTVDDRTKKSEISKLLKNYFPKLAGEPFDNNHYPRFKAVEREDNSLNIRDKA